MKKIYGAMAITALILVGCGETKKMFAKSLPDETQVIDGPSLAVPPDFELRPPRKADDYETLLRNQKTAEAHNLITGVSSTAVSGSVPNDEQWVLDQTGSRADPNVRDELSDKPKMDAEDEASKGIMQRWFGKKDEDE